jgi:hypothetical protein
MPHVINTFGGHGALGRIARLVQMGAQATGGGISTTPEAAAAVALTAALHDPAFLRPMVWACAVYQNASGPAQFVAASREGMSWTPPGMFLPDGVTLAHHDPAIDPAVRQLWRGLQPYRVLAAHARILGQTPAVVVVRTHEPGLDSLFAGTATMVVAVQDSPPPQPNPLRSPAGRHRLLVASPDLWWQWVAAVPEDELASRIREIALSVAAAHDAVDPDPLRALAVAQIGRGRAAAVDAELADRAAGAWITAVTMPVPATATLTPGWNHTLVTADQILRGWETLALAQADPTREALAEVVYSAQGAVTLAPDDEATNKAKST